MSRNQGGFTLIEMMLSVAVIGILAGLSFPIYASFNNRNDLQSTTEQLVNLIRRAELYARTGYYDDQWSISLQQSGVTLFKGTNFGARNTAYDETVPLSDDLTLNFTGEVPFAKQTGAPLATGAVTITSSATNESRTVSINAKGALDY